MSEIMNITPGSNRAEARYFHQFRKSLAALEHYHQRKLPNEPELSPSNQHFSSKRGRRKPEKT